MLKLSQIFRGAILAGACSIPIKTVTGDKNPDKRFEIDFLEPGAEVFVFTFG